MNAFVKISHQFLDDNDLMLKVVDAGFNLSNRRDDIHHENLAVFNISGPGVIGDGEYALVFSSHCDTVMAIRLITVRYICQISSEL